MIRALTLTAALALATPALAEQSNESNKALLKNASDAAQARQLLAHQGYVNISTLEKDSANRWSGTAYKDGELVRVAIIIPSFAPMKSSD